MTDYQAEYGSHFGYWSGQEAAPMRIGFGKAV
jgi:hypothetical protein